MTFDIKVNEIKNETLAKLTRVEIGNLGLVNCGCYTYKGSLKSRVKGLKVTMRTESQVNFESESNRWEVIKIVALGDVDEYAIRLYNKERESYEEFYPILIGCDFFR